MTFEESWSLGVAAFKQNYGLLVGVSVIMVVIALVEWGGSELLQTIDPLLDSVWSLLIGLLVTMPLGAGLGVLGANMVRAGSRGKGNFEDLFVGYKRLGALLGWTLLSWLVVGACIAPAAVAVLLVHQSVSDEAALVVGVLLALVYLVLGVCIGSRFYPVASMLVDPALPRLGVIDTAKASWRATGEMVWLSYFLVLLTGGLALAASILLLCVGLPLLGYPIYIAVSGAAYAMVVEDYVHGQDRCVRCGYDLRGVPSAACPECGARRDLA